MYVLDENQLQLKYTSASPQCTLEESVQNVLRSQGILVGAYDTL